MRCECGRFSAGPVCGYCLTGEGTASGVKKERCSASTYVIPRVERTGLLCSCGEPEPMVAEIGQWIGKDWVTRGVVSRERLLWYRCVACGSVTRETLVPAAL